MFSSSLRILCSFLVCCFLRVLSLEATNNGGFTVELFHRDSPHSPLYDAADTRYDRLRRAIQRSFDRKSAMASASVQSFQSPIRSAAGEYLMKVHIGTPPVEQLGIADTGSDLTWMQCRPCTNCYKQKVQIFNPRQSKTYRKVSCKSEKCAAADGHTCVSKNRCLYNIFYDDNSYSNGELSTDTFTLGNATFLRTIFGCSHDTAGTFVNTGSGIIGLGGGALSIINQLNPSINGKFSYCLPLLTSNATGKISFGANAVINATGTVKTPIVKKQRDTFYYLTLEAISVDKQRFEYKNETKGGSQKGNIVIDSGTTLTYLDGELVNRIEAAMNKSIEGEETKDAKGMFGLCYKQPRNGSLKVPRVTVHLEKADVVLAENGVFVEVENGVLCLTFVGTPDLAIYGNLHQMNYEVGYDFVKKEVSFLPAQCSK